MRYAIVIGCGKIGAQYDLDNENLTLTHAKAYFLSAKTELYKLIDTDIDVAKKVAKTYQCAFADKLSSSDIQKADIISIATPTEFHLEILELLHVNDYKGKIILEKPAVSKENEIEKLLSFHPDFLNQITMNYIRRFDRVYAKILYDLKTKIYGDIQKIEANIFGSLEHNGVHVINILNYIFQSKAKILFVSSQTVILQYENSEIIINILHTPYINFDLTVFTDKIKIVFDSLGYTCKTYKPQLSKQFKDTIVLQKISSESILHSYALDMIEAVIEDKKEIPTIYEGITDMKTIKEIQCWQ